MGIWKSIWIHARGDSSLVNKMLRPYELKL